MTDSAFAIICRLKYCFSVAWSVMLSAVLTQALAGDLFVLRWANATNFCTFLTPQPSNICYKTVLYCYLLYSCLHSVRCRMRCASPSIHFCWCRGGLLSKPFSRIHFPLVSDRRRFIKVNMFHSFTGFIKEIDHLLFG